MSPAEDAALLLRIVRRHLQAMRLNLDPAYPDEEWGFQAHQALEKLLKAAVVLRNQAPERTYVLEQLARQLGEPLPAELMQLQVYAVEARYEVGPFALESPRVQLLAMIEERLADLNNVSAEIAQPLGALPLLMQFSHRPDWLPWLPFVQARECTWYS